MGTCIVLLILLAAIVLAIRSILRARKNGTSCHCGGNCAGCGSPCTQYVQKIKSQKKV